MKTAQRVFAVRLPTRVKTILNKEVKDVETLMGMSYEDLIQIKGIGDKSACLIIDAQMEAQIHLLQERCDADLEEKRQEAADHERDIQKDIPEEDVVDTSNGKPEPTEIRECFGVVTMLNGRCWVLDANGRINPDKIEVLEIQGKRRAVQAMSYVSAKLRSKKIQAPVYLIRLRKYIYEDYQFSKVEKIGEPIAKTHSSKIEIVWSVVKDEKTGQQFKCGQTVPRQGGGMLRVLSDSFGKAVYQPVQPA